MYGFNLFRCYASDFLIHHTVFFIISRLHTKPLTSFKVSYLRIEIVVTAALVKNNNFTRDSLQSRAWNVNSRENVLKVEEGRGKFACRDSPSRECRTVARALREDAG